MKPTECPRLVVSESVTEGHPDKVADYVSDAVLDACLERDSASRVACETLVKTGTVVLAGEITTRAELDLEASSDQPCATSATTTRTRPSRRTAWT